MDEKKTSRQKKKLHNRKFNRLADCTKYLADLSKFVGEQNGEEGRPIGAVELIEFILVPVEGFNLGGKIHGALLEGLRDFHIMNDWLEWKS